MWPFVSGSFHWAPCFQGFVHIVAYINTPFLLWLRNIPWYGSTTFHLSIQPLMDHWVVSTFWRLWIMLLWPWVCVSLFKSLPSTSVPLGRYPGVEWRGHMVALCLTFQGTTRLFSTSAAPFDIPISKAQHSPRSCQRFYYCLVIMAILLGGTWYFTIALFCISLMTHDVDWLPFAKYFPLISTSMTSCLAPFFPTTLPSSWC